jgi:predicted nucleic acid-binding protein
LQSLSPDQVKLCSIVKAELLSGAAKSGISIELDQAREYFLQCVVEVTKGLSDAQWRFKPALDR